jgi:hypothetical protein
MKHIKFILMSSLILGPLQAQGSLGLSKEEVILVTPHAVKAGAYGALTALMATGVIGSGLLLGVDFFNPLSANVPDNRPILRRHNPDFWPKKFPRDAFFVTAFTLATVHCFKKTKETVNEIRQGLVI